MLAWHLQPLTAIAALNDEKRRVVGGRKQDLTDPSKGFKEGNGLKVSFKITSTIVPNEPNSWMAEIYSYHYKDYYLVQTEMKYALQLEDSALQRWALIAGVDEPDAGRDFSTRVVTVQRQGPIADRVHLCSQTNTIFEDLSKLFELSNDRGLAGKVGRRLLGRTQHASVL